MWTQTVHGKGIDVIIGTDFGGNKDENSDIVRLASEVVISSLSSLPKTLASKIGEVVISPFDCPRELKENPNDVYNAVAFDDKIVIFKQGISDTLPSTIVHEAAHNFKNDLLKKDVGFLEKWKTAIAEDGKHQNSYSKTNESEDFSESTVAYLISKNTPCESEFKKLYPHRYNMLNALHMNNQQR